MQITLANKSKYDIEINCENQRYLVKSNCVQDITVINEPIILRTSVCDEIVQDDVLPKKLLEKVSNLALDVECTYEIENICDGMTLDISHEAYTFSGESFFLPFLYTYPAVKSTNAEIKLIDCFEKNEKKVLKLYRSLAFVARIGTDGIIVGIFSAVIELFRVKRLCKKEKVFATLSKQLNAFYGKND